MRHRDLRVAAARCDWAAGSMLFDYERSIPGQPRQVSFAFSSAWLRAATPLALTHPRSCGCTAKMWGDASSAVADTGFYPHDLHWKLVIEAGGSLIKDLLPGG